MALKSWQAGHRTWRRDQRDKRVRPTLTLLEERALLSTLNLTVTTLADDPVTPISEQTTLRDAITQANASTGNQEIINFGPGLQGTIDLTSTLPTLNNNISIQGPGASYLTVQRDSGAGTFSVFTVDSGQTVSLSGMTIAGGNATTIMGLGDSSGQGGGINNAGTLTVNDSTFTGNSANGGANSGGGGIYNSGTLMVNDSTFTDNSAPSGNGGGIWSDGTLMVNNSTFTSNSAISGDGWGGGIENDGTLMVTNSTFTNNSTAYGGGIFNDGTTVSVTNSTFTNNSAPYDGGGIYNNVGVLTVTNSTFTNNSTVYAGGGIFNNVGVLTVTNTIVAGNTGNDIRGQVQPTSGYNLIGNGTGITNLNQLAQSNLIGTTADPINPMLGPLANNGGPTQTMALLPSSLAINAGSNALAVDSNGNPLITDQRGTGFPRVVNGTVDIGAYESTYGSQSQTISFPPIPNQTYGVAPITLTATSSSNLPVTYIQ